MVGCENVLAFVLFFLLSVHLHVPSSLLCGFVLLTTVWRFIIVY